jgi:conjugative transfer relaxase protein TraI
MMSVAPVASAGSAAGYYSHSDNYYFLGNLQSLWLGEGARDLGLEGQVQGDALTAVLEGRLPDGSRLGKEVNGNHVHRPGHDLTFSAPKSVSILALIGGDKEMVEAHNHAVRVAAGYVEKLISARDTKDGVTSIIHTGKMVAAVFTHDTSRNLDPQLHSHLVVANLTEQNGKWKALATDYIHDAGFIETVMKMQVTLGKIYRNALRERVESLGHEVETVGKHGMWEIKGVPEEIRDEFSSRGREIQGAVGAEATLRSRDVAAKDTRRAKVDPSRLRLMERWQGQMKEKGFDLQTYQESLVPREPTQEYAAHETSQKKPSLGEVDQASTVAGEPVRSDAVRELSGGKTSQELESKGGQREPAGGVREEVTNAVKMAISQLSDGKTRFTWGELMLTATEFSEKLPEVKELKQAIDVSLREGLIIPLDSEKGVFTSRIHLLDELSIQALSQDHLKSTRVVSFSRPEQYAPPALEVVEKDSLVLLNAPSGVSAIRGLAEQLTAIQVSHGREVQVLASSAERATSLARSDSLRERLVSRQQVLNGELHLKPQSTLIIEGAERLGLKETLILLGEARDKDAQLVFMDSAGRQANGNAMSVLESAGVTRSRRAEPTPGLEATVTSIPDKRERYDAMASRFAELSGGNEPVTAIVVGQREQTTMTGLIRDALQNAGQLERDGVTVEARSPVWLDSKTRRMPGSYRAGQVLEDRSDAKDTRHYVIDRVHDDTRVLSLIDGDGVLVRHKISELTADWRLFNRESLEISTGEKLIAIAGDKQAELRAKDRLQVTGITEKGIGVLRDGKALILPTDKPLYVTHGYVAAPGGRDNDNGIVLAALNTRDITAQTMNSLAQSGQRAEVFTAETQERAEARLQRMGATSSPVQLVQKLSGQNEVSSAVETLQKGIKSEAQLAVWRTIEDQRQVSFSELHLTEQAAAFHNDQEAIGKEISSMLKSGDLLSVAVRGEPRLIARATWEMEKAIIRVIDAGKGTQAPLMEQVAPQLLDGLTGGQKQAAKLVLNSRDQFTGIQGYAGVGKTTQVKAVKAALETLPAQSQPVLLGLAPTHQAVKEMRDVGIMAQTLKSFLVDHDKLINAGEKVDYRNHVILIDESSMVGNQDTAAVYQAIQSGGGRAVSMGDIDQFDAVDSGAPFKLMQERSPMDVAIMKEIVRQKDVQLKDAVHDIIDNRIEAALKRIETQPQDKIIREEGAVGPASGLTETGTPVSDIVGDWITRTPDVRNRTIIITQLNADRKAVNAGIHEVLLERGELGKDSVEVPVLEKISHTRHEFNKTTAWSAGMVVKRGDQYQDVIAVDRNGSLITVRNEDGRLGMYSPRELITGDVELFTRSSLTVREGSEIRFTATDRERGQAGNERFTVEAIKGNGELTLQNSSGKKVINPNEVRAEQHIDYAWAVTGYGAQGASSDYVISLEGTEEGRKYLATRRAFYISASRAKEHVQIYTDGKSDWVQLIKRPEQEIKTAHDALKPETQRQQAKAIWAMGQPVTKTAIGRTWVRHQALGDHNLTAKIIPATRRFPEPALALPLYDNNGKSAGLALISLVSSPEGRLTQGTTRMVATEGARGAVLQRSQSGNTIVVKDVHSALQAIREHPAEGVVWQTGEEKLSTHLMKISRGTEIQAEQLRAKSVLHEVSDIRIPAEVSDTREMKALQTAAEVMERQRQNEQSDAAEMKAQLHKAENVTEKLNIPQEENISLKPEDITASRGSEPVTPDAGMLRRIVADEINAVIEGQSNVRSERTTDLVPDKTASDKGRAALVVQELANSERDIIRPPEAMERGRTPVHDEPGSHTRTIQKER